MNRNDGWVFESFRDPSTFAVVVRARNGSEVVRIPDLVLVQRDPWYLENRVSLLEMDWLEKEAS